jgi:Domain of unknown function (DUF4149)
MLYEQNKYIFMSYSQLSDLIISANVGVIVFFTLVLAPTVFKILPSEWAAKYVRSFFPKYYVWLGLTSVLAAVFNTSLQQQILLVGTAAMFFFSCWGLTPLINKANDNGHLRTFKWLHGSSVALNIFQLGLFCWLLTAGAK